MTEYLLAILIQYYKQTIDENKEKSSISGLSSDPIPNSPNQHHKNCMALSGESY